MKKVGIIGAGVISIGLLLGACGEEEAIKVDEKKLIEETKPVAPPKEEKEVAPKEKEEPIQDLEEKPIEEVAPSMTAEEEAMKADFEQSFAGVGDITFDIESKMYIVHPTDPQVAEEIAGMINGTMSKESWYRLVEATVGTSNRILDSMGPGYSVAVANPVNDDNVILLVTDGLVLYDVFGE